MTPVPLGPTAALGVHTLASRLVIYGSAFAASVLVARGLGPAGNGLYATAMTIGTIAAMLGHLGFEQAQAKAWSRARWSRAELLGAALRVAAVTGGAGALLVVAVWTAGRDSAFDGFDLGLAIAIVAGLVPGRVLLALLRGLLIVGGDLRRSNVALAIGDLARTLAIVVLALTGALTVETVLAAFWLTVALPLALHAAATGRPRRPPGGFVRAQLREGARLTPYFGFLFLNLRLDVLLLAALAGSRAVGIYAVAVIFAELVWLATDSVTAGARERQWSPREDDALAVTAAAARMSLLIAALALPPLAIGAPIAIGVLFGEAFGGATDALWALLPAVAAMAWWRALSAGLVRFGRRGSANLVALAALAANVALNVWLVPRLGLLGAGLASLGSYAVGALLAARAVCAGRLRARELLPGIADGRRLAALVRGLGALDGGLHRG